MHGKSLKHILSRVTLVGLLPTGIILGLLTYWGQDLARENAKTVMANNTVALASQYSVLFATLEGQMRQLAATDPVATGRADVCDAWLTRNLSAKAPIQAWSRLTPDGKVVCSTQKALRGKQLDAVFDPRNPSSYGQINIDPVRVSQTSNKKVLSFSHAFWNDGDPYQLAVSLDAQWFLDAIKSQSDTDSMRYFMVGDAGHILLMHPHNEQLIGKKVPVFQRLFLPSAKPRLHDVSDGTSGKERIASTVRLHEFLDGQELFFSISASPVQLFQTAHNFTLIGLFAFAAGLIGVILTHYFAFDRWLAGPMGRLLEHSKQLAQGEADSIVFDEGTPRELVELSNTMDYVAGQSEARASKLREAMTSLHRAEEVAGLGHWSLDIKKQKLFWSDGVYLIHGLEPRSVGIDVSSAINFYHPESRDNVSRAVADAIETGKPFNFEERVTREDGTSIYVRSRGDIIVDKDGNPTSVFGIIMDIDAPRQARRELIRAQAAAEKLAETRSKFLAKVTHEVRAPLAAFISVVQRFERHNLTRAQLDSLDSLDASGQMLLGVIGDLLDAASVDAGSFKLSNEQASLRAVLSRVHKTFAAAYECKDLKFTLDVTHNVPQEVLLDVQRLKQILFNLLTNAFKFTQAGEVALTADADEKFLKISVSDTGIGIRDDVLAQIFTPYNSSGSGANGQLGGTGLGLSIVKTLVEQMQGSIKIKPKSDAGTEFVIRLPLRHAGGALESETKASPPAVQSTVLAPILFVEDNPVNQKLLHAFMKRLDHPYIMKSDGQEAMEWLLSIKNDPTAHPLVALVDINMPRMNGIALAEFIRSQFDTDKQLPIYLVTADVPSAHESNMARLSINGWISKPIDFDVLQQTIEDFIPTCPDRERHVA